MRSDPLSAAHTLRKHAPHRTRPCACSQPTVHHRRLALQLHPDKNRAAGAEEAFKVASKAFDTLSDPQKRAAYDQYGEAAVNGAAGAGGNPFAGFGGGMPGFHVRRTRSDTHFTRFAPPFLLGQLRRSSLGRAALSFYPQAGNAADLDELLRNLFGGGMGGMGAPSRGALLAHSLALLHCRALEHFHSDVLLLRPGFGSGGGGFGAGPGFGAAGFGPGFGQGFGGAGFGAPPPRRQAGQQQGARRRLSALPRGFVRPDLVF